MMTVALVLGCALGAPLGWWARGHRDLVAGMADLDRLRADNAALRSLAYDDWLALHPDVPPDEAAARFDLAVAVRAAGLARGDGGIAGDQT